MWTWGLLINQLPSDWLPLRNRRFGEQVGLLFETGSQLLSLSWSCSPGPHSLCSLFSLLYSLSLIRVPPSYCLPACFALKLMETTESQTERLSGFHPVRQEEDMIHEKELKLCTSALETVINCRRWLEGRSFNSSISPKLYWYSHKLK